MSILKLFTDEHIAKAIVDQLRKYNIGVVRCEEVGMKNADDSELLEYATEQGYVLLSMDDDVTRLDVQWRDVGRQHTGIFYAPMAQFQGQSGIGAIVTFCAEWAELIEDGTGTLEDDIHGKLFYIKKQ